MGAWYGQDLQERAEEELRQARADRDLQRERRVRADARHHLKPAFEAFVDMRADGFAERARHELLATGEKVRKRTPPTPWTT